MPRCASCLQKADYHTQSHASLALSEASSRLETPYSCKNHVHMPTARVLMYTTHRSKLFSPKTSQPDSSFQIHFQNQTHSKPLLLECFSPTATQVSPTILHSPRSELRNRPCPILISQQPMFTTLSPYSSNIHLPLLLLLVSNAQCLPQSFKARAFLPYPLSREQNPPPEKAKGLIS